MTVRSAVAMPPSSAGPGGELQLDRRRARRGGRRRYFEGGAGAGRARGAEGDAVGPRRSGPGDERVAVRAELVGLRAEGAARPDELEGAAGPGCAGDVLADPRRAVGRVAPGKAPPRQ